MDKIPFEVTLLVETLLIPMPNCYKNDPNNNDLFYWSFELKRAGLRLFKHWVKNKKDYELLNDLNRVIHNENLGHHIQFEIEMILQRYMNISLIQLNELRGVYNWEKGD